MLSMIAWAAFLTLALLPSSCSQTFVAMNNTDLYRAVRLYRGGDGRYGDINEWDTSKVTNMEYMFYKTAAFNQYVGGWDTSKVTSMRGMFFKAKAFNQDLGGWNTSQVSSMNSMFLGASAFSQSLGWCISSTVISTNMFALTKCESSVCGTFDMATCPEPAPLDIAQLESLMDSSYSYSYINTNNNINNNK